MPYQANPSVLFTKLDENEGVLLHTETRLCYSLNETGLRIWELLANQSSIDEIAGALAGEYLVEAGSAATFVADFVEMLKREELVLLAA